MALLDTTVLIDLNRPTKAPLRRRAQGAIVDLRTAGDVLCTSRINEAEFRVGEFRSANPDQERQRIEALLSTLVILEFDSAAALQFAQLQAYLLGRGRPCGDADAMIAAVALANGQLLLTRNVNHFSLIPRLVVRAY